MTTSNKKLFLLVWVFFVFVMGCGQTQDGIYHSPAEVIISRVSVNGVVYEMETTAHWTVLDDPECGVPEVGGVVMKFIRNDNDVETVFGFGLNFGGLNLPQMPLDPNELELQCPRLDRPRRSSLGFVVFGGEQDMQLQAVEGLISLEARRISETMATFQGEITDALFIDPDGNEIVVHVQFDLVGRFSDSTYDKRFPYQP